MFARAFAVRARGAAFGGLRFYVLVETAFFWFFHSMKILIFPSPPRPLLPPVTTESDLWKLENKFVATLLCILG